MPPPPYFWSDQYGVRIQFAGIAGPGDEVTVEEGDPADRSFLAVYRRDGEPVAVLGMNQVRLFTRWRRQLATGGAASTPPHVDAAPSRRDDRRGPGPTRHDPHPRLAVAQGASVTLTTCRPA